MKRMLALTVTMALTLGACGSAGPDVGAAPTTSMPGDASVSDPLPLNDDGGNGSTGFGPGISVADALSATADGPYLVNGYVFVLSDGSAVVADAIAESYPPQPAGAQVALRGFDLTSLPLTEGPVGAEIAIVAWTDTQVQLLGDLVDGELVADALSSA